MELWDWDGQSPIIGRENDGTEDGSYTKINLTVNFIFHQKYIHIYDIFISYFDVNNFKHKYFHIQVG